MFEGDTATLSVSVGPVPEVYGQSVEAATSLLAEKRLTGTLRKHPITPAVPEPPGGDLPCPVEVLLDRLARPELWPLGRLSWVRRIQGAVNQARARWRDQR